MKTINSFVLGAAALAVTALSPLGFAQTSIAPAAPTGTKLAQSATADMTEGEVRKVDKENKKITLKHGEIKNLGMPGMTMVFRAQDPAMLENVQVGEKVRFRAEKAEGSLVVTRIEAVK